MSLNPAPNGEKMVSESLKKALLKTKKETSLTLAEIGPFPGPLEKYAVKIKELLDNSVPKNTRKAFQSDLNQYLVWWHDQFETGEPFPISDIALAAYITHMKEIKTRSTIMRSLASISKFHTLQEMENPAKSALVKQVMKGIERTIDGSTKQAAPIGIAMLSDILNNLGSSWVDRRNAAILCVGWCGALRCSEIAELQISDLGEEQNEGIILNIRHSKTDQTRKGAKLALPYSAIVERIIHWKSSVMTLYKKGPLFPGFGRHDKWFPKPGPRKGLGERSISIIVKESVKLIGLDPNEYSPHSLRAGLCTDAARYGCPEHIIQRHSRHVSSDVLRGYIRQGNAWEENPLPAIFDIFFGPSKQG